MPERASQPVRAPALSQRAPRSRFSPRVHQSAGCEPSALPPEISFQEGTLFEPLAVVLHSLRFVQLQPGETAAVFGAGPIGLLTIFALKLAGAGRVWSVEPVAERRDLACRLGADAALDPTAIDPVRQLLADTAAAEWMRP